MPKLNLANEAVQNYFTEVGLYWIREFGIDGWRLDVADEMPTKFLEHFAATVKEKYPDALLLGETWGDADRLVSGNRLDCAMNYLFKDAVTDWIAKDKISVSTFDQRINRMAYEFNHYYELQNVATGKYVNVLGNHEDGTVKNGETVNLFSRTNNPDQRWALENFGGNGNVRIVLQRGEGWYALNYNTRNTNCIVWHLNTADDTDTVITTVEVENRPNTYYLMLRDRSIYLTAVGTALKWSAYTGEEEQMFTILEPGTGSDGSDSGEVSNVPDSKLVTKFIPAYEGNYTKDRKAQGGTISEITIHHCASILTIDALGALWQREGRKGSSHYGVSETNIGQYVHESDVAWTNGNWEANCRAVTIETSNGGGAPEWPVSDTTFQTLVTLVADIARRNGLGKLVKGKNLTWHSMYAATACPGPYLSGKLQELVDKANTINGF